MSNPEWSASVVYTECSIDCPIERAWERLMNYEEWNPSFAGSHITRVRGAPRTEGELVLIRKTELRINGEKYPEFYAETVKIVPQRHIVWYIYPKEGSSFRNFVDLGLTPEGKGVRLNTYYYAQNPLFGESLQAERNTLEAALNKNALAFKKYCESGK